MKVFILSFSTLSLKQDLITFLDARHEILNWYSSMPTTIFLVTELNAEQIRLVVRERYPAEFFFVGKISGSHLESNGWLPAEAWQFIQNPRRA
jgi:hypothetical protein